VEQRGLRSPAARSQAASARSASAAVRRSSGLAARACTLTDRVVCSRQGDRPWPPGGTGGGTEVLGSLCVRTGDGTIGPGHPMRKGPRAGITEQCLLQGTRHPSSQPRSVRAAPVRLVDVEMPLKHRDVLGEYACRCRSAPVRDAARHRTASASLRATPHSVTAVRAARESGFRRTTSSR
jgi:hypothetical protein